MQAPPLIDELLDPLGSKKSKTFRTLIRSYNAMFAMTSMGGKVDSRINDGRHPYIFKLNGQNHHRIGTLLPNDGEDPQFAQLYFYDTENEVQHRMNFFSNGQINSDLDPSIVDALVQMFDESNNLVKIFQMSRDRFIDTDVHQLRLRLIGSRTTDGREYNLPTCSEITAIIVGDIELKEGGLQHINVLHPSYMDLQYPLLFPYGEDDGIRFDTTDSVTMKEYYAYQLQERKHEEHTLVYDVRLFQQFDLMWVKQNQDKLRIELDTTPASSGKRFVLPSSFTGNAMAICRWASYPDLFITFTCNTKWPEIDLFLSRKPGQKVEDRPNVVARVFKIKLDQFLNDLKHGQHFGKVIAVVYTVEYQKRGLPHAHILLFLHHDDKHPTTAEIDRIILAEIPDLNKEPYPYEAVKQYMVHGPCGSINSRAGCMIENKCTKHFPKKFCSQTTIDEDGFPIYKRRSNGRFVEINEVKLDNRFIVPHNIELLVKFQAHINVEWCNRSRSIKYLFKYITKGPDRATLILEENLHVDSLTGVQHMTDTDEVKTYLNCRYVSAIETCWRIFEDSAFTDSAFQEPAIQRLGFHNEDEQPVLFEDTDYLNNVVDKPANALYEEARELTYSEFPTKWVWHRRDKEWKLRKSRRCIGCIYYAHPTSGERFYFQMLLNVIKGARSFEEMRTINNVVYPTFRSTCYALGLLDDDKEWHEALNHASYWASRKQLRELFILIKSGRSLHDFESIPYPNTLLLRQSNNRVLQEELDYDRNSLAAEHIKLLTGLNIDQRNIYDEVINSVSENKGGFFFVYGHGGTGKTYLWKTIISRLRSEGKIFIAIASFGIAALLLPRGRTAHSRFQIPINVTDSSTCGIKQGSQIVELMTKASLIIWDEAPMAHRNCFKAVDRSLRDILCFSNSNSGETPFGGKTIVLGGDFKQILPVVSKGRREQIVEASINKSSLWNSDIATWEFAKWILKIGDGELSNSEGEALIEIPHDLLIQPGPHPFNDIVKATYPDFDTKFSNAKYLEERAILAPTNEVVKDINGYMIDLINVDEETYLSADSLCKASSNILDQDVMYPIKFLNSLKFPGIPNHKLRLKVGLPIMLLRNLNQSNGLCNGTRLLVTQLSKWVLEAQIISGTHIGEKVRQFPVSVCFAMTINKSQGQSLQRLYVAISRVTSKDGLRILIVENDYGDRFHTKNIVYKEIFDNLPKDSYCNEVQNLETNINECEMQLT
ncbi:hypothetical protein RGQ29_017025 [Quercus rubra]|uniref:ATP-dependent DNA helicase n=1 Tax=Quercus rubra TaxID=3512 RepID=A0AAN7IZX1_QUERU|nr:hypothetical protein RGQ29_017025 [Quercus rubra]